MSLSRSMWSTFSAILFRVTLVAPLPDGPLLLHGLLRAWLTSLVGVRLRAVCRVEKSCQREGFAGRTLRDGGLLTWLDVS